MGIISYVKNVPLVPEGTKKYTIIYFVALTSLQNYFFRFIFIIVWYNQFIYLFTVDTKNFSVITSYRYRFIVKTHYCL